MDRCLNCDDYDIAWIAILPIEAEAALAVLDRQHDGHFESETRDDYILLAGEINGHNIVIATLPAGQNYGVSAAAALAAFIKHRFVNLWFALLVGVAAGTPNLETLDESRRRDIRLGDVLVALPEKAETGIVQYDLGRDTTAGFVPNGRQREIPPIVRSAIGQIRLRKNSFKRGQDFAESLVICQSKLSNAKFHCPSQHNDKLFSSAITSQDTLALISRPDRDESERTLIWYGNLGSGSSMFRNPKRRDEMRDMYNLIGLEMEAAGVVNVLPTGIVRGVCDYGDAEKNKDWQPYAAAVAAVYAKGILQTVRRKRTRAESGISSQEDIGVSTPNPKRTKIGFGHINDCAIRYEDSLEGHVAMTDELTTDPVPLEWRARCLESLKFDQIDSRQATIKPAHRSTCSWLYKKLEYKRWMENERFAEHHGFFWIKGKPATGKSTVTKFIFTNIPKTKPGIPSIAFFFNARGDELEKNTLGMYRSLLVQLMTILPDLQQVLDKVQSDHKDSDLTTWNLEQLKHLFSQAISALQDRSLICFIDALDECHEDEVRDMLQFFEELSDIAISQDSWLRIWFSSRHYPNISVDKGFSLTLEDQEGHYQDLESYIQAELRIGASVLANQIKKDVLERASGIFLWVVLVIPMLVKGMNRGRVHEIRRRLQEIPMDLEKLFDNILKRDGSLDPDTLLCLRWALYCRRPMHPTEMYYAILAGLELDQSDVFSPEIIDETSMSLFILDVSKGLLEETKGKEKKVQFIHESVRDYFLKGKGLERHLSITVQQFALESHDQLKRCCQSYYESAANQTYFKYLKSITPIPKASSSEADILRKEAQKHHPFLRYAIQNVFYHSDQAQELGCTQETFLRYFLLRPWLCMRNMLERYDISRYSREVSLPYIFAEQDLPYLITVAHDQQMDINAKGERYGLPLFAAFAACNERALTALMSAYVNATLGGLNSRSFNVSSDGFKDIVTAMRASKGVFKYSRTQFPLIWAAENGIIGFVQCFSSSTDVNAVDKVDRTALSRAAGKGHSRVVELLLMQDDIDADLGDRRDRTPLSYAASAGHQECVKLLLDSRNNVKADLADDRGITPLSYAALAGHQECVKLLLDSRNNVKADSKDRDGRTPLSYAAANGRQECVQLLLDRNDVKADSKNNQGYTPIWCAAYFGYPKCLKLLLDQNDVEADSRDKDGRTPLSYAAQRGNRECVQLLLARNDVGANSKDNQGKTPLLYAVTACSQDCVKLLLDQDKLDVNRMDNLGATPLLTAVYNNYKGIVRLLLDRKDIMVNMRHSSRKAPLSYALEWGYDEIVNMLRDHGATEDE